MPSNTSVLYFPLPDYRFYDTPHSPGIYKGSKDQHKKKEDPKYINRKQIEDRLDARIFEKTASTAGAVIVTGFRGSGKSSVVRRVIYKRNIQKSRERGFELWFHELNLAQDDINERVILKLIAKSLHEKVESKSNRGINLLGNIFLKMVILSTMLCIPILLDLANPLNLFNGNSSEIKIDNSNFGSDTIYLVYYLGWAVYTTFFLWLFVSERKVVKYISRYTRRHGRTWPSLENRLEHLLTRIDSNITTTNSHSLGGSSPTNIFNINAARSREYKRISNKEIELEVVDLLKIIGKKKVWCGWKRLPIKSVFLIDELDKLIPQGNVSISNLDQEDLTDEEDIKGSGLRGSGNDLIRKRQASVAHLFANIKHFLNVAEAKFVFIGGRELFDAILADTSNRDPYLGSLFYDSIYVPSFLKEEGRTSKEHKTSGITSLTEQFVAGALLKNNSSGTPSLSQLIKSDKGWTKNNYQCLVAIQEFICYLTFRSNGIPKKLVSIFESYIVPHSAVPDGTMRDEEHLICGDPGDKPECLYIRFTPDDLYTHHLLFGFFRPFIAMHARSYRSMNDMMLVSFTYVLDHLFKFHSFSFHSRYLEMTPELVAINKVPEFRSFMAEMIGILGKNQIRTLHNGLFDYQFYKKSKLELTYLTKVSEMDSAALNFTLDESLPLKQHYYKRLRHLTNLYTAIGDNQDTQDSTGGKSRMLVPIYESLGDLHFFDSEFDQAAAQYRNGSTASWVAIIPMQNDKFNVQNALFEYVKLNMKRILCLEKMRAYGDALALNADVIKDVVRFIDETDGVTDVSENWRLYLSLVMNRVSLIEKNYPKGVGQTHIDQAIDQISGILKSKRLVREKALAKLHDYAGQILFIKNDLYDSPKAIDHYEKYLRLRFESVYNLLKDPIASSELIDVIANEQYGRINQIAGLLSRIGDCHLNSVGKKALKIKWKKFNDDKKFTKPTGICSAMAFYQLSAMLYRQANDHFREGFQLKKIIYAILEMDKVEFEDEENNILLVASSIETEAIGAVEKNHSHSGILSREKYDYQSEGQNFNHQLHGPYFSEIVEIKAIGDEVRLRAGDEIPDNLGAYDQVSTKFAQIRILNLKVKDNLHEAQVLLNRYAPKMSFKLKNLKTLDSKLEHTLELKKILNNASAFLSYGLSYLIADSIYCCTEMIRISELFGPAFINRNNVLYASHDKLALWTILYHLLPTKNNLARYDYGAGNNLSPAFAQPYTGALDNCRARVTKALDRKALGRLDPTLHTSLALKHLSLLNEEHSGGNAYRRALTNINFLEEDYSDNLIHFSVAIDRFRLTKYGADAVKRLEDNLEILTQNDQLFRYPANT